jgi:hypothetical protein
MNRGSLGARALNAVLQQALNPEATPRVTRFGWTYAPGDKVLQTVNNYEKDVYNGDIGRVAQVDLEEGQVEIDFDGRIVTYDVGGPRSWHRPLYAFRGGLSGAGASSTASKSAANIERGF